MYVREEEPGSESVVSSVYMEKNNRFTCRHYELMTSKEENLISYMRHSDARLRRRSRIPLMGVVEFELFPGVCVFSHISVCVCFVLVACQGIPMQVL